MTKQTRLTHYLEHQRRDGTWRSGVLAYSLDEARGVARDATRRTGRAVRIIEIGTGKIVR